MKALTLTELNKQIDKFGLQKMAPEGLMNLILARAYLLGETQIPPAQDPRDVLVALGRKW